MAKSVGVVGGGASGLMTALLVRGDVTVYEPKALGKKLLVTGNGRCNLTNAYLSIDAYNRPDIISRYIDRYGYAYQKNLFERLGLLMRTDSEGRVYPVTNMAESVLDVIKNNLSVTLVREAVASISKSGDGYLLTTESGEHYHDIVVVSTGGSARILDKYISTTPLRPSLVPLETAERYRDLDGLRVRCHLTLSRGGEVVYTERGEVLFRKYGVSGICVMNSSAYVSRVEGEYTLSLDMLPDIEERDLVDILTARRGDRAISRLDGILSRRLSKVVLDRARVRYDDIVAFDRCVDEIVDIIKHFTLTVTGARPIEEAQVTCGGYSIDEVEHDLSVDREPNLYITGEALDIDGLCGGYNLAWAWISASVVSESINAKI